ADASADSQSNAGHNTFKNGNNTVINIADNSAGYLAMTLSTLLMMESLRGNQDRDNLEPLISQLTNTMNELLQGEYNNRKAIIDALKSLKEEEE
ncbi:MAG: hypothetical protein ACI4XS_10005, partial [Bacillus sp. (in: firmicutes)]